MENPKDYYRRNLSRSMDIKDKRQGEKKKKRNEKTTGEEKNPKMVFFYYFSFRSATRNREFYNYQGEKNNSI